MIVLDSAARVFCGGIDIGEYTRSVSSNARRFSRAFSGHAGSWQARRLRRERPGPSGGAERRFRLSCHATPKAPCSAEISIGVFPPLASTILPFLSTQNCFELVLTGEPVTAERALDLGMVIASSRSPPRTKP